MHGQRHLRLAARTLEKTRGLPQLKFQKRAGPDVSAQALDAREAR